MTASTKVSVKRIFNEDIRSAVFKALDEIEAKKLIVKSGLIVLIKPNLLMGKPPERAVNTHPEVVRAVIQWVKQFDPSKIYVCDSSGGQKPGVTEKAIRESGIGDICEQEGVECFPLEKSERKVYFIENPLELKELTTSKIIEDADLIINIPKIKTHWQCTLTCCIKNMFGTVLLANKAKTHAQAAILDRFSAALADIYSVSKPQLTVVDGYYCMEGQGPSSGDVVKLNLIMAGYDGVALDTIVCKVIGFDPEELIYLKKAEGKGLGTTDLSKIELVGEKIETVYRKFKRPKLKPISMPLPKWLANYIGKKIFKASVKFNKEKCKLCSTCWSNCPVGAISPPKEIKKGNIPIWNSKKCITCFCCVELCPYEAVKFKINYVKNVVFSWFCFAFLLLIGALWLSVIWFL
jgi:uncharacterized protein (DUF362 family)/NAD-dependent dihydropyrimidine dehydrogenase PreA subunit